MATPPQASPGAPNTDKKSPMTPAPPTISPGAPRFTPPNLQQDQIASPSIKNPIMLSPENGVKTGSPVPHLSTPPGPPVFTSPVRPAAVPFRTSPVTPQPVAFSSGSSLPTSSPPHFPNGSAELQQQLPGATEESMPAGESPCALPMATRLPTKSSIYNHFNRHLHQHNRLPRSNYLPYDSGKRLLVQPRKVVVVAATPIKAAAETAVQCQVKAVVTVKCGSMEYVKDMVFRWLDSDAHRAQTGVVLQLVSTQVDPNSENPKLSKEAKIYWSINPKTKGGNKISLEVEFVVDANFGVPGAIIVTNKYKKEFYLESIVAIEGLVHFACNSWVQPHGFHAHNRIFFSNKVYLPNDTPVGLKRLREKELQQLRGNSDDSRTTSDRIYDYDVYNDLGNPDKGDEFVRPILGNQSQPYPRRCRSKRPPTSSDVNVESPVSKYMPKYVPRDEAFGDLKAKAITEGKWKAMLRSLVPTLKQKAAINGEAIKSFSDITELYKESLPPFEEGGDECWEKGGLPKLLNKMIKECGQDVFKFDSPKLISRDIPSCCLRDDELGRLTLAGMNPLSIERLKVFPPVSNLDPSIYGPQDSALKEEQIICHLNGMSVQQAIEENKLFILDYHDVYLPFLDRINAHPTKKAYATRTIFVLTDMGSLKPIAIELSLPEKNRNGPPKCVVTPPVDATTCWLWQLGKAHVCSNDAGAHQLIHHWLRTHACLEPFIIAAHRQLSVMHPIYKLLHCHMRYTMDVNAQGRQLLLNAGGIIESHFFTAACSMEVSASVYQNWWRFDMESLPADLIRRGMAVPDATEPHGLKLLIEDYPYATDGLLIWSAIEQLVQAYVHYYYPEANIIESDSELNAWYHESINIGHADIRHASWWLKLSTPNNLISILTTIIWLASAHHAAVNFGMYPYGGYFPVRPPFMRRLVPNERDPDYTTFLADPEGYFLASLPCLDQMLHYISVLDILSTHSADEEYLGDRKDLSAWAGDPEIVEALYKFSMEMKKIGKEIEKRNGDPNLRNRCGAGISPYELLLPSSGPGVTCRGVPNSVSI